MRRRSKFSGRALAFSALWRVEVQGAYADVVLDEKFEREQTPPVERALATELTQGVLRWQSLLDYYLCQLTDRPWKKIERRTRIVLRLGAYQVLFLSRMPVEAAVNESVALAPGEARGFVNAVLRSLARRRGELKSPEKISETAERLAVVTSHPRWLVERWLAKYGEEFARELGRANNQRPRLTLRVNPRRGDRDSLLAFFQEQGIAARPGRWSRQAVVLEESRPVSSLPGFAEGRFSVQDEASQLAVELVSPRRGELVLDACAAPGTKSLALAELMSDEGRVIAVDRHARRLARLKGEMDRLGLSRIAPVTADATALALGGFAEASFDRILLDAPCSGLGTLRRRPEIKWRRRPEDLVPLAELQRTLLRSVSRFLKPGGLLVYSTCTLTEEENEEVVGPFLLSGDFYLADPVLEWPGLKPLVKCGFLRTWPHLTGADGFTIVRLRKR